MTWVIISFKASRTVSLICAEPSGLPSGSDDEILTAPSLGIPGFTASALVQPGSGATLFFSSAGREGVVKDVWSMPFVTPFKGGVFLEMPSGIEAGGSKGLGGWL